MCKENKGPDAYATIRLISWQVLKVCHKSHWSGLNSEVKLFLFFPLLIFFHGKKNIYPDARLFIFQFSANILALWFFNTFWYFPFPVTSGSTSSIFLWSRYGCRYSVLYLDYNHVDQVFTLSCSSSYPETFCTKESKSNRIWLQTHKYLPGKNFKD